MGSFILLGASILVTGYFAMMYESAEFMLLVYLQAALFVLSFFPNPAIEHYGVLPPVTKNILRGYYTTNVGECQAND